MRKLYSALFVIAMCIAGIGNAWGVTLYSTDIVASPTGATMTSATGAFESAPDWGSPYTSCFHTSGSAGYCTITFSSAIDLSTYDEVNLTVHWGATANRPLNVSINGGSTTQIDAITSSGDRSKVREAGTALSVASLSSIKLSSASGGNMFVFDLEITATSATPCTSPTSVTISGTASYTEGQTILLSATPTGGTTPTGYQWYLGGTADGNAISGATSSTFTKAPCTTSDAGNYYCKIATGATCSTFSSAYPVTVAAIPPSATPVITQQPSTSNAEYQTGDAATALSVTATSSAGTLTYQWYSSTTASNTSGTPISGATSNTYTPPTSSTGTTYYYCVVTNTEDGKSPVSVASNVSGSITVSTNPLGAHTIIYNLRTGSGESSVTTLSKSSSSSYITLSNDLSNSGLTITSSGKTDFTTKIEAPSAKDDDKYMYVTFVIAAGYSFEPTAVDVNMQAVSAAATADIIFVDDSGNELLSNKGASVNKGAATHIGVSNTGHVALTGTVTLRLYCYGASVADYRLGTPITIDGTVAVAGSLSATPVITTQPVGAAYCDGDPISPLTVVASVSSPHGSGRADAPAAITLTMGNEITYQWKKDGVNIAGATSDTYTPSVSGLYSCVVTNTEDGKVPASVTSNAVTVTINGVIAAPTFTQSGNNVNMSSATGGATIYYTTDGSTPTTSSTEGTSVRIHADCTVTAFAVKDGCESAVTSFNAVYDPNADTECVTLISYTFSSVETGKDKTIAIAADANNLVGGSAYYNVSGDTPINGGYKLGSKGKYVGLQLATGQFLTGDQVTIEITQAPGIGTLSIFSSKTGTALQTLTATAAGEYVFTLPTDCDAIYVVRNDDKDQNPYVKSISVCREMLEYKVTFDKNNASATGTMAVQSFYPGFAKTLSPNAFSLASHAFAGWATSAGGTKVYDDEQSVTMTASITLYALWTPISPVTLHTNGGTIVSGNVTEYAEGTATALPTDVTRDGYAFIGWFDNAGLTGSPVTEIPSSATGAQEFWAKWELLPVLVWTYSSTVSAGGTYPVTVSSTSDGNITLSLVSAVAGVTPSFTVGNPATGNVAISSNPAALTYTYRATIEATANHREYSEDKVVIITKCETPYNLAYGVNYIDDKTHSPRYYHETEGLGLICKDFGGSGNAGSDASWDGESWITKFNKSSGHLIQTYRDNVIKIVYYVMAGSNNTTIAYLRRSNEYISSNSEGDDILASSEIIYNVPGQTTLTKNVQEIIIINLATPLNEDDFIYIGFDNSTTVYGAKLYRAEGDLPTGVAFSGESTLNQFVGDEFVKTAVQTTSGPQSNGTITYSSTDETVATVDPNTGAVTVLSEGRTRIIATLHASGCYKEATAEYVIVVKPCTDPACEIAVTSGNAKKCTGDPVTLTATAVTGATFRWYRDDVLIPGETGATLTTTEPGIYYAEARKVCMQVSNTIRVVNLSDPAATALHTEYYIKAGRVTPDIPLFRLENAASFTVSPAAPAGCHFELRDDDILYLCGTPDAGLPAANYTLTATAVNGCGGANASASMLFHILAYTSRPSIAWIGEGDKGETLPGSIPANQSTSHTLYQYLQNYFDLTPVNAYCTNDTNKIREYYSQFDLILLTDYPDTHVCPSGQDGDANSYSNAIGCMIDEKPILTFEAFVAGLPNWGINTKPQTPDPKQTDIILLCTAHDIFDGTVPINEKIGFLTEIGGNGMQGFTGLEAPADMIFIATIDDGDGGQLITCCERQAVVEARMMIMGLNYGAMTKVSDDGKRIIKQIIDYLLQTTSVADCALIFDNATGDHKWSTPGNWAPAHNLVPKAFQAVRIEQDCNVDVTNAHCSSIRLVKGTIGPNTYDPHLTILPQGGLTVTGFIKEVHDANFMTTYAIAPEDLVIQADATSNGTLVFGNEDQDLSATVQYYSSAYGAGSAHPVWQYMGIPIVNRPTAISQYLYSWMCSWENVGTVSSNWVWVENEDKVIPFKGYCITQAEKTTFTHVGVLNHPEEKTLAMQYFTSPDGDGFNMFANSWVAPINITKMKTSDFNGAAEPTIFIYNTGSRQQYEGGGDPSTAGTNTGAGQYNAIPVAAASYLSGSLTRIPTMQGFFVQATKNGNLTLDYNRLCFNTTDFTTTAGPMRSPRRAEGEDPETEPEIVPEVMRIDVNSANWGDRVYILTHSEFSEAFERGWDGSKQVGDNSAPMLAYAGLAKPLAVAAIASADDQYMLFRPGEDSVYTFSFDYDGETIYLVDQLTNQVTEIRTGNEYTFVSHETVPTKRFLLTTHPALMPTDITLVESDGLFHFDNYAHQPISIRIVDMQGRIVYSLATTDAIVDIAPSLPSGVYLAHIVMGGETRTIKFFGKEAKQ